MSGATQSRKLGDSGNDVLTLRPYPWQAALSDGFNFVLRRHFRPANTASECGHEQDAYRPRGPPDIRYGIKPYCRERQRYAVQNEPNHRAEASEQTLERTLGRTL